MIGPLVMKYDKWITFNINSRGDNRAEISGPARKFFCSARPGINILQILYNGLNILCVGGGTKTQENFVKYGYNLWFN